MKITSDSKNINRLNLSLKSVDTRMSLYTEPFSYAVRHELEEPIAASITFDDSREIDILINALQKFKEQNEKYIGYWE